jgi:hypothetical protein
MFFLGIDLGKRRDHTAVAVVERRQRIDRGFDHVYWRHTASPQPEEWIVRRLERLPLGTAYTAIADHLVELDQHPTLRGNSTMVVDATGVGAPVVDMLRARELKSRLVPIVLTSGNTGGPIEGVWTVPKVDLLARLQVLFEQKRLRIVKTAPLAPALINELVDVRSRQQPGGQLRIGADAAGQHDDLVMAVALAVWPGAKPAPPREGRIGWVNKRLF